jgi:hypothetical protein
LRAELDDLTEVVKMKDRMLDDQNVTIGNLKQQVKQSQDEVNTVQNKQEKYY